MTSCPLCGGTFRLRPDTNIPSLWNYTRCLVKDDSNAVDVGAHIGSFLSLLLKQAPKGQHIAFEPSRSKSEWLKKRFPAVDVVASAVADEPGSARFVEDTERPGFSHLEFKGDGLPDTQNAHTPTYEVSICRLDDILSGRRVDLIKLDIEGGELLALRGTKQQIARCQPSIIFECGPEYALQETGANRAALFEFIIRELNYRIYTFPDFLFNKGDLNFKEFEKCGLYPFRAFNFVALPRSKEMAVQMDRVGRVLDFRGS
jgi:FkbM family methyltransferase